MIYETAKRIKENIKQVICGKDEAIDILTAALFCRGHILLEDIPGTGKTALASAVQDLSDAPSEEYSLLPTFFRQILPESIFTVKKTKVSVSKKVLFLRVFFLPMKLIAPLPEHSPHFSNAWRRGRSLPTEKHIRFLFLLW